MKSIYASAAAEIDLWINENKFVVGTPLPSIRSLAAQFQFKTSTANRACQLLIARGLIERKGYKMFVARIPAAAMILPVTVISAFPWFNRRVAQVLHRANLDSKTITFDPGEPNMTRTMLKHFDPKTTSGLIMWPLEVGQTEIDLLRKLKVPVVVCGCDLEQLVSVMFDADMVVEKAIRHLIESGHRNIALLSTPLAWDLTLAPKGHEWTLTDAFLRTGRLLGLKAENLKVFELTCSSDQFTSRICDILENHPEITAFFAKDFVCYKVFEACAVPSDISVVGYLSTIYAKNASIRLTAVEGLEHQRLASLACSELISQVHEPDTATSYSHIRVAPRLIVRSSVKKLGLVDIPKLGSRDQEEGLDEMSWNMTYPFLIKQKNPDWHQVDLEQYANRSLVRRNGWLGGHPLLHFPPGLRSIHRVPFRVINEEKNNKRGAVVLLSRHTHTSKGRHLTTRVEIPVNSHARAVYFLHGCAWPSSGVFAHYRLQLRSGKSFKVPMIAWVEGEKNSSRANIQDWWPQGKRRSFLHAYPVLVTDWTSPLEYERYLYTLEWVNPRAKEELESISIEVNTVVGTSLGLIAITILV